MVSWLLPLLLLGALAACPAGPEETGCTTDADCPSGRICSAGTCGPPSYGGGGSGGEGPLLDECGTSADCLPRPFPIVPTIYWDGSLDGSEQVCTVPLRSCPGSVECPVPTVCAEPLPEATRLGAMRCERDDQCASGRCIALEEGISICLRVCTADGDCPQVLVQAPMPPNPSRWEGPILGFRCEERVDHGIPLRLCVPMDPATPAATLCRSDCDCSTTDDCQLTGAEPRCRFTGYDYPFIEAVPVCEAIPTGAIRRPTLAQCRFEPESCAGGACILPCQNGTPGYQSFCRDPPYRCTQPCDGDDDCPARTVCRDGDSLERIGSWMLPQQEDEFPGRSVRYCQLPPEGCFDELDCCPVPDGQGGCVHGWSDEKRRCGLFVAPPEDRPRLLTKCLILDPPSAGPATPGQCCAAHADCDSNLCVPARPGTPCEGGGVCSVPCDPDPYPYAPDPWDPRDRCALADFGSETYHQGSRCLPYHFIEPYTGRDGAPATLEVELNACQ